MHIKLEKNDKRYGYYAIKDIPKHTIILIEKAAVDLYNEPKYYEMFQILYKVFRDKKLKSKFSRLLPDTSAGNTLITCEMIKKDLELLDELPEIRAYFLKINAEELLLYCLKYLRNGFGTEEPIILFKGAMMNHSCIPNVIFIQEGNIMYFVTARDIQRGEEICDTYLDITLNKKDRQKRLLDQYGFICRCERCIKETRKHKNAVEQIIHMSNDIKTYKLI